MFGHVESEEADAVQFRSVAGVVLVVPRAQIADLRVVEGRVFAGEFLPADSHNTRLLFAPTGRSLKKGEGYFGVYELVLPFVQVGVTDRLSIGGGTPLTFGGGGGERPFWFTPKLQLVGRERMQIATGVIHFTWDKFGAGIAYRSPRRAGEKPRRRRGMRLRGKGAGADPDGGGEDQAVPHQVDHRKLDLGISERLRQRRRAVLGGGSRPIWASSCHGRRHYYLSWSVLPGVFERLRPILWTYRVKWDSNAS